MSRYAHIDTVPPKGAREAAARHVATLDGRALTVPDRHARAIAEGRALSPATVRHMAVADATGDHVGGEAGVAWARRTTAAMEAADRAATAGDGPYTGVAVVLPLAPADAEYLALPAGLPPSELHVTLAFLGKTGDLADTDRARITDTVAGWAAETPALPASLSGTGRFHGEGGAPDALHLTVDAAGLSAARENLVQRLRAAGFDPSATHGFDPHATLLYLPAGAPSPVVPYDLPVATRLARVALWWGDDRTATMALAGRSDPAALTDRPMHGEGVAITFADAEGPRVGHTTDNQIARLGTFLGHPQGPVSFTPEVFDQIIANFRALKNGEVPGDYEHASERPPPTVATDGVPAPFWVKAVRKAKGGAELWATFEWVDPQAVEYVRSGQYKYLSPAVRFNAKSRETGLPIGAVLTSCALTNHPFIDGMEPVTASARTADAVTCTPSPDALHAPGFGPRVLPPHTPRGHSAMDDDKKTETPAEMSAPAEGAEMRAPAALPTPPAAAPAVPASPAPAAPGAAPAMSDAFLRRCCETMGMTDAPTGDHEAMENEVIARMQAMVAKLAEIQKAEADRQMERAASMSARVIAAGLAPESARATLTTMCMSARETFDTLYPAAAIDAAETRQREAAEATARAAAPKGDLPPVVMSARVDAGAAAILQHRIGGAGENITDAKAPTDLGPATFDERVARRVEKIMKERSDVSVFDARTIAERDELAALNATLAVAVVNPPAKPEGAAPAAGTETPAA